MAGPTREGDWQCPNPDCINHQQFPNMFVYGTKVNCPKCGTGKTAKRAGDWCCPNIECVNHTNTVYGSKQNCSRCGVAKPVPTLMGKGGGRPLQQQQQQQQPVPVASVPAPLPAMRQGDWYCPNTSCKNNSGANFVYGTKNVCGVCGTQKPQASLHPETGGRDEVVMEMASQPPPPAYPLPAEQLVQAEQQYQVQPEYELQPEPQYEVQPQLQAQVQYLQPQYQMQQLQTQMVQPQQFQHIPTYPVAQFQVHQPAQQLHQVQHVQHVPQHVPQAQHIPPMQPMQPMQAIYLPRPDRPANANGRGGGQPGDWHCPNASCKNFADNVVYASKSSCPLCGTPKPGGVGLRPSAKLHEGDWQCPTPGCKNSTNFVYASKSACSICGALNPNLDPYGRPRSRSPLRG